MGILPSFPLTVGIVGEWATRESEEALRSVLAEVLRDIQKYSKRISEDCHKQCPEIFTEPPFLRLLSSLEAETDCVCAEEALKAGYKLEVVQPSHGGTKPKWEPQIPSDALAERRAALHGQAQYRLHVQAVAPEDGNGRHSSRQRHQAKVHTCMHLVRASDILIAVWRGDTSCNAAKGWVSRLVHTAVETGIPVIWVLSSGQNEPPLLKSCQSANWLPAKQALMDCMEKRFSVTANTDPASVREPLINGLRRCIRVVQESQEKAEEEKDIQSFRSIMLKFTLLKLESVYSSLWKKFEELWYTVPKIPYSPGIEEKNDAFTCFDAVAVSFARLYRSSLLVGCALSALALVCATLAILSTNSTLHYLACFSELFLLSGIIANYRIASGKQWQRHLTNTRFIAECLRSLIYAQQYGYTLYNFSGQLYYRDEDSWVYWLARCIIRSHDCNQGTASENGNFPWGKDAVTNLITSQIDYHSINAERSGAVYHALHTTTVSLFCFTVVAVALELTPWLPELKGVLAFCSIACPVVGMAAHTLSHYAELKRLRERSKAMQNNLQHLLYDLYGADDVKIAETTIRTVQLMVKESADWKIQYKIPDITVS